MRKRLFMPIFLFLLFTFTQTFSQPKIIFDTDLGGDVDDLGALAMLHNFMTKGECEVLAVMCWTTEVYAVPAIDAVNRYYGHPELPIGTRLGTAPYEKWNYSRSLADNFEHKLKQEDVIDATILYRKILASADDKSIIIVTVGPLMNIQNLINSQADSYSQLTGKELITKKVKEFVIMGGQFPEGKSEWNFNGNMPGVTRFVLENISVPVVFTGYEVGNAIKSGEIFNSTLPNTPLYLGFMHFSQNAHWIKDNFKGKILNNASFDQTAVLYAVRNGIGSYWEKVEGGFCNADETGGNTWDPKPKSNHSYLRLIMNPDELGKQIESFMLGDF